MGTGDSAIIRRPGDGHFEFARQELEFRVIGGPLADQFGIGARIVDFIGGGSGEMVGGDVADGVAGGLDRVETHFGQCVEHIGHVTEFGPVELDVLAGGEVAITTIPALGHIGELAHLRAVQRAVGDGDTEHIGVKLEVEAVHQAERAKLVFGERTGDAALDLGAELGVAGLEEGGVEIALEIHGSVLGRSGAREGVGARAIAAEGFAEMGGFRRGGGGVDLGEVSADNLPGLGHGREEAQLRFGLVEEHFGLCKLGGPRAACGLVNHAAFEKGVCGDNLSDGLLGHLSLLGLRLAALTLSQI